jgi:hypothetical protein
MIKVIIMLLYLFIMIHMLYLHRALLMLIVEIGLGIIMLCLMRLGKHAIVLLVFIMHVMLHLYSCKNAKVVARKLGSKCKGDKTYIWVLKIVVTNLVGPNKSWVPKTEV